MEPLPARGAHCASINSYNAKLSKWLEANPQIPGFVKRAINAHKGDHVPVFDMDTTHPQVEAWDGLITVRWDGHDCNPII